MWKAIATLGWITSIASLLVATLVIIAQVFLRYIFSIGLPWAAELARYLIIYISLIGAGLVIMEDAHPSVDVLIGYLKGRPERIMRVFFDVVITGFLLVLFWEGWKLAATSTGRTPALRILWRYPYISIPLGAGFMILFSLRRLFVNLRGTVNSE